MMARFSQSLIFAVVAYFNFAPCLLARTGAADDVQKFVDGLRERRYFDTAAEYLESLASDAQVSPAVKQLLPYEHGLVLIQSGLAARDPAERNRQFDLAQTKLKAFLSANKTHDFAIQAQQQLAGVLRFRADAMLGDGSSTTVASPQDRKAAGKLYDEARGLYNEAAKRLRSQLDELPKGEAAEKREQLGVEWLGARLNAARTMFEMASAHDPGDDQKKMLAEAAGECGELYSKFPQRLAGSTARFYEGRCYQALGDRKKAVAAYGDLIADLSESDPDCRRLKTQAIKESLECWLEDKNYTAAVEKGVPWAKSSRGAELRDPDWLAVKLSAATALKALAEKAGAKDAKASSYVNDARELAGDVARSNYRELQTRGRMLLAQLNRNVETPEKTAAVATPEVKTFDEAYEKAEESTDEIKTSQLELDFLEREPKPDAKEIAKVKESIERNNRLSFEMLKRAVELADQNTDREKLATAYYQMGFFHYQRGNYLEASIFGELVARKFSDLAPARTGARVALAALDTLFRQAQSAGEDVSFESGKLAEMANYVTQKWPGEAEADVAFDALLSLYLNQGEFEKAAATLDRIKADSPSRAEAEAKLGQMLWAKYLHGVQDLRQQDAGADVNAQSAESAQAANDLNALVLKAQTALERSIELIRKQKEVNPRMVIAALSLAQIYIHASQSDLALKLLEDPKIGPITLLNQKQPATQLEGMPAEIYKTAMKAYVGVEPQQIEKATAAMDALEKIYAGEPDGENKFMVLLIGVAADMKQQLQALAQSGQAGKQEQQIKAFEQFLRRIAERKSGADFRTLAWVASTYQSLAEGISTGGKPSKQAQAYFQRSAKAYQEILDKSKSQPNFVPEDKLPVVKLQLAIANRGAGEYDKAIASFAAVLKEKPNLLPIQVEAAKTFQSRADDGKPEYYVYAIKGGMKGDAASIWGWGQLAVKTSSDLTKFQDFFHEARYNMAVCYRRYGAAQQNAEQKTKAFKLAKEVIRVTKLFETTMGGEKWRPQYDKLLRDLQQALGDPVVGLQEFETKTEAVAPADEKKSSWHRPDAQQRSAKFACRIHDECTWCILSPTAGVIEPAVEEEGLLLPTRSLLSRGVRASADIRQPVFGILFSASPRLCG